MTVWHNEQKEKTGFWQPRERVLFISTAIFVLCWGTVIFSKEAMARNFWRTVQSKSLNSMVTVNYLEQNTSSYTIIENHFLLPPSLQHLLIISSHVLKCLRGHSFAPYFNFKILYLSLTSQPRSTYPTNHKILTPMNSPTWESSSLSHAQEIARLLWNPKFHYRVNNSPLPNVLHLLYSCFILWLCQTLNIYEWENGSE
jgi:hypothetical protein